MINGKIESNETTIMNYPTNISKTLKMTIEKVSLGEATLSINADSKLHGNQQNTIHGGLLCELADQAIGTAHSTFIKENETFASVDLKINFFAPTWKEKLFAVAKPIRVGKNLTHYECRVLNEQNKVIAYVTSIVMTLRGTDSKGR
jgi:uncharacterized protein (TIGR00369 family)